MEPTLKNGQTVLVNRLLKQPRPGAIIVFKDPRDGKVLIKRVIKVKENRFFVLGDNELHSTDSRKFGMISKRDIVGKVIFIS